MIKNDCCLYKPLFCGLIIEFEIFEAQMLLFISEWATLNEDVSPFLTCCRNKPLSLITSMITSLTAGVVKRTQRWLGAACIWCYLLCESIADTKLHPRVSGFSSVDEESCSGCEGGFVWSVQKGDFDLRIAISHQTEELCEETPHLLSVGQEEETWPKVHAAICACLKKVAQSFWGLHCDRHGNGFHIKQRRISQVRFHWRRRSLRSWLASGLIINWDDEACLHRRGRSCRWMETRNVFNRKFVFMEGGGQSLLLRYVYFRVFTVKKYSYKLISYHNSEGSKKPREISHTVRNMFKSRRK